MSLKIETMYINAIFGTIRIHVLVNFFAVAKYLSVGVY
mgnify:CR=1 FL=1